MRLAIVISHPIQYYSPWFRHLAKNGFAGLRVFYLWERSAGSKFDPGFGINVNWDVPLLNGYDYEFVANRSRQPGTSGWRGLNNPELAGSLERFQPQAVLLFGYNYLTHYRLVFSGLGHRVPLLFRGDSHRLPGAWGRERKAQSAEHKAQSRRAWSGGLIKEWLRRRWIRFVFRRFAAFLYVGRANKTYFQLHGVLEQKLFFCPQAVDNERFFAQAESARVEAATWKASLGIAPEKRVVLFAGKFEPVKRPRDLVAAFKQTQLNDAVLLLVGNGEQEEVLRQDATGWPDIVFAPFQNQTQMPRTYVTGDVFVLPSFRETWGLAVNEAMCMGRPVIVSSHVGCAQDLVQTGRNGLVFPAGDVTALAAALREALSEPQRLQSWGAQSREIIRDYDYEHATEGLKAAAEAVLPRKAET